MPRRRLHVPEPLLAGRNSMLSLRYWCKNSCRISYPSSPESSAVVEDGIGSVVQGVEDTRVRVRERVRGSREQVLTCESSPHEHRSWRGRTVQRVRTAVDRRHDPAEDSVFLEHDRGPRSTRVAGDVKCMKQRECQPRRNGLHGMTDPFYSSATRPLPCPCYHLPPAYTYAQILHRGCA